MAVGLARAVGAGRLKEEDAERAHEEFLRKWPDFGRVPMTQALVTRADRVARDHGLPEYDAVQLAAALTCQDTVAWLGNDVVFACFDNELRGPAVSTGLQTWSVPPASR